MKRNGFVGKGSGKLGASVFAISGGEQIVRQYNPKVANPNTDAQVAQRAKLKLMSQLAAAVAPALGFVKQGLISARNLFVSANIGEATFEGSSATFPLEQLKLTPSSAEIPAVNGTDAGEGTLRVALASAAPESVKRVAYFVFHQTESEELQYVASTIVNVPGVDRTFNGSFAKVSGSCVVYAYGIKDNSTSATIKYNDYVAAAGDDVATLDILKLFRSTDYNLTKTTGVIVTVA